MPEPFSDDEFLLERLQLGDPGAFEYMYLSSRNRLFALANAIIGDQESSRDLVQEFFTDLLQSGRYKQITSGLKTYLYRAIRNRALKFLRDKASLQRKQNNTAATSSDFQNDLGGLEYHLDHQQLSEEIETAIGNLPFMAQKVFILHYLQFLSHAEIAGKLNISKHTVSNHMDRALKGLRAELKKNL